MTTQTRLEHCINILPSWNLAPNFQICALLCNNRLWELSIYFSGKKEKGKMDLSKIFFLFFFFETNDKGATVVECTHFISRPKNLLRKLCMEIFKVGDSTTSLINFCHCSATLTTEKCFLLYSDRTSCVSVGVQ